MKSEEILMKAGIEKDNYPADACFGEKIGKELIGTYSKDRKTVCIMADDNLTEKEKQNFASWSLDKDVIKEIAYTCNTLITDFGCNVHSWTMKNTKPFSGLKIIKPCNLKLKR